MRYKLLHPNDYETSGSSTLTGSFDWSEPRSLCHLHWRKRRVVQCYGNSIQAVWMLVLSGITKCHLLSVRVNRWWRTKHHLSFSRHGNSQWLILLSSVSGGARIPTSHEYWATPVRVDVENWSRCTSWGGSQPSSQGSLMQRLFPWAQH